MKIITFAAIKGGVGKTTLTFNFGEWLAEKGHKVLLIDSDHQCSLTQTYSIFETNGTIAEIFKNTGDEVKIIKVKENLSIIPSSIELDLVNNAIQTRANKELLVFMWFGDNYDNILKNYDYVLIDCHPDFSTITQNMIAISDVIFSPIEPSEYGFMSKSSIEVRLEELKKDVINVATRKSFITAELKFIGNRIKHNTKSSREFVKVIEDDKNTLALINEKELFNRSTLDYIPLVEMEKDKNIYNKNKEFFKDINKTWEKLQDFIG